MHTALLSSAFLALVATSNAYPSLEATAPQHATQPYIAPGPDDSRGPCPALNTLANHGYLNRDGRNLTRADIIQAFDTQFGVLESAISVSLINAFTVCSFVSGVDCGETLSNLTLLAEPHAFEHDHSFSREDYMMDYLPRNAPFNDNQNFNKTIFQASLDVVAHQGKHVNYSQVNEIRLQRESLALQNDKHGWFMQAKSTQEFEAGYIIAVMGDFNLPHYNTTPIIRKDWWAYWFHNESFPYELGWHPPAVKRDMDFMLSVSSRVLAASVRSTPSPLPSGAIGTAPAPAKLQTATFTTTYAVPTFTPYAAMGLGPNDKRDVAPAATTAASSSIPYDVINPYKTTLAVSDILAQQAYASSAMQAWAATASAQ